MKTSSHLFRNFIFGISLILGINLAHAAELGTTLPPLSLDDASGQAHTLSSEVKRIYATGDRASGNLLKNAMSELNQAALDAQNAIVIADISAAPGFVKGMIRSGLKDRNYTTWVDSKGKTKKLLPYQDNRVTMIDLDEFKITAIRQLSDEESLKQEILKAPAPTSAPAEIAPELEE